MRCYEVAERGGFEPPAQVTPGNCLAGSPVQPLQHLSARWHDRVAEEAGRAGLMSTGSTKPPARDRRFYASAPGGVKNRWEPLDVAPGISLGPRPATTPTPTRAFRGLGIGAGVARGA